MLFHLEDCHRRRTHHQDQGTVEEGHGLRAEELLHDRPVGKGKLSHYHHRQGGKDGRCAQGGRRAR